AESKRNPQGSRLRAFAFRIPHLNIVKVVGVCQGDAYQILLFSLIYIPVLIFSVYISWNSTLKSRTVFLHHLLNDYHRKAFEKLAHTDALTGLNNRRYFESLATQHVHANFESPNPTTLLVFDVDHFKQINDSYGHDIGDRVLQMIADVSSKEMRYSDILARYGGEEFIALLTGTNSDDAVKIAERLRKRIENIEVNLTDGRQFHFTVSIGITILETFETDLNVLIKQADIALYQAKANGRNRVEYYDPSMDQSAMQNMKRSWNIESDVKMIVE
ncbi:GGDEF domain-containing protein, partial [Acinetobacter wanghuae]|uniref:GGDEF domain-containing protein n=1 Tax=Acinetobacter wanghuae TaxID=2662362 RepID=UPI003AF9030B